jgi:signal transduction histidine kinase
MKLLIIDDERPILDMLELSLSEEGYDVLIAENGERGLEMFRKHAPELVLTDVKMPGIDGIEVLRRIKAINKEAEVIVITGHGDMETAIAALQNQASDFVTKPIRDEVLMLSLDRAKKRLAMSEQIKTYTDNLEQQIESCRLELLQAQEEVIRTERRASIGETVAALAHCIKNVLTGLGGGMYMAQVGMAQEKSDMLEEGWAMFQRNMERVSDLILDLLRYSTERTPDREICTPNQIVSEAVELLEKRADENDVKLKTVLDSSLKEAYLARDDILKVLSNVISNAIEACIYDTATSKAWEVSVSTKAGIGAESSDMVIFEVTDNGCGMTDEVKAQLFHRFFTTKPGMGVGFDLLVTQKIIHEHGGEISLESEPGEGTTFSVRLNCQMPAEYALGFSNQRKNMGI